MKTDLFAPGNLAVELSESSQRKVTHLSLFQYAALILAHLSEIFKGAHGHSASVTLTLDTSAHTSGDVLADTQEIPNALRGKGRTAKLDTVVVVDKDDQTAAAMDLVFFKKNVSLGTENAPPSITDDNTAEILGIVNVPSNAFVDVGGAKIATVNNIGLRVSAPTGTSIWMAVITRGTPTQTANGIVVNLGFDQV